jgi:exodeoxyribonuclease VII small subunit
MTEPKFEEAMGRLEEMVKQLETGTLPLEESLKVFEEGIRLSRWCVKKLEEVEKRVEILLENEEGELQALPWNIAEENLSELEEREDA